MEGRYCPQCKSIISASDHVCPQCLSPLTDIPPQYPFPTSADENRAQEKIAKSDFLGYKETSNQPQDLYQLAKRQRFFLTALLFLILSNLALFYANFQGASLEQQAKERGIEVEKIVEENPDFVMLTIVSLLGRIVSIPLAIVAMFRLTRYMRYGLFSSIVLSLTLFIPLISLIVMIVINSKATKVLQEAGYQVGLFGVNPKQFQS